MNFAIIQTSTPEITFDNNTSTASIMVQQADLQITKTVDQAVVLSGDAITYTLHYRNNGPYPAYDVVITDIIPEGVSYVSSTPTYTADL